MFHQHSTDASENCLGVEVNALKTMTDRAQEELVEDQVQLFQ